MKLQFKKVQKRANELGLGLARFNYTGQDANGEKIKYAYRMFVANNEEQSRFDSDSRHGFDNFSGRDNFLGGDLGQADYMSLIAVAHAIEGYALAGDKGLGVSQEDTYYLGGEFQTRKNIYTTYFAYNAEEMNERVGEYDSYCNDADINSSVLAEKVRKQY